MNNRICSYWVDNICDGCSYYHECVSNPFDHRVWTSCPIYCEARKEERQQEEEYGCFSLDDYVNKTGD